MGEIIFKSDEKDWVMALKDGSVIFNRERWPDALPDEFARAVIGILEKEYTVKFEKKEPPYNRNEE
jgi:hypothetical protein